MEFLFSIATGGGAFAPRAMSMPKSLLEQLPLIVAKSRQGADLVLERRHRASLQTREWVLPARDTALLDWIKKNKRLARTDAEPDSPPNRLIHGNNLLVMAALLNGDGAMPSLRGRIGLIHIDPPFRFRTNDAIESTDGIASYLEMMTPRLILMRELLSPAGSICMHVDRHAEHYVKAIVDEIFGGHPARDAVIFRNNIGDASAANQGTMRSLEARKHRSFLEERIAGCANAGCIVADFFGSRGDTAAIAERLGCRWIVADSDASSCMRIRKGLIDQSAEPFLYQAIDEQ